MCSSKPVDLVLPGFRASNKATMDALTPDIQIPQVPTPPAGQDAKMPDASALLRRRRAAAGTLLTGPGGVTASALTTGAPTLLGG